MSTVVVKLGSSTVTDARGVLNHRLIERIANEVADLGERGDRVIVVTSGAIAVGWASLAPDAPRPTDIGVLQAVAAVGQPLLMRAWHESLLSRGVHIGQVLLDPIDFGHRRQYLHAKATLSHLLDAGVLPIVNENDAVTDEEIRFGDNDRLSALVALLVEADLLVLLSDIDGLFTKDPRLGDATLIDEIGTVDDDVLSMAGGAGSALGSGGMASKLAAARIATWSGIETVIANGERPRALSDALDGRSGVGTRFVARPQRLAAKKVWIAFARDAQGSIHIDDGAVGALIAGGGSLLAAGVRSLTGTFEPTDVVEVRGPDGALVAKGICRYPSNRSNEWVGVGRDRLPDDLGGEVIHRDELVVMVEPSTS